ncbi:protein dachsous-like [Cydia fagiglandana]|uniref:protein dachsous-like n=1 Tax=Cydia fagiglandana TaxID=1458189 RepID=UPI002FEDE774
MAVNLLTAAALLAAAPLITAQDANTAGHDCSYMQAIPRPERPSDWPTFNFDGMEWATRPLLPAPDRLDLCMDQYYPQSATSGIQLIFMDEDVEGEIAIAKLNYQGTETPVMHFTSGRNALLGAVIRQDEVGEWYIYVTQSQDFEEGMIYYLFEIHVEDEDLVASVALTIVNIDNKPPRIEAFDACQVDELGDARLTECVYNVHDPDGQISTSVMAFEIESDRGDEDIFYIEGHVNSSDWFTMTMTIGIQQPLDFEANALHIFTVNALDSVPNIGPASSASIMVQVQNVEHRPPRWVEVFAVQQFDEKTAQEFTVRAIDGDTAINKPIYYDIITEEGDDFFSITTLEGGRDGGVLHVAPIDRDALQREVFRLTLVAYKYDNRTFATEANVVIIINDINDQFPEPMQEEYRLSIPEETPLTLYFGDQQFGFHDRDLGENAQYDVRLVSVHPENVASAFYVAPEVGYQEQTFIMGTVDHAMLDYEVPEFQHIEIQVVATDRMNSSLQGVATVYIDLINWNDEEPIFEADSHTVTFEETVGAGFYVTTVRANDRDIGDRVEHSLMGNAAEFLSIDEATGAINVSIDDAFDYHRQNEFYIQVRAVDTLGDGPYHTATNMLTINILDINNTPPSLRLPRGSPHVEENVPEGYVITTEITATDPDTTAYLRFEIDWETSYATKQGRETPAIEFHNCVEIITVHNEDNTGAANGHLLVKEIRDNVTIDFEEFEVLYLTVRVVDQNTYIGDDSDEMTFTIIIVDMNDNWPIWSEGSLEQSFLVRENATSGVVIGSVLATDIDGPLYNQVRYSIQPIRDTPEDLVNIDFRTGQLTVGLNHAIDADLPPREYLYYTVTASDRCTEEDPEDCPDDPTFWETPGEISIYITDTNNKEPQPDYTQFQVEVEIYEDAGEGSEVVQLVAADQDREGELTCTAHTCSTTSSSRSRWRSTRTPARAPRWCSWWPPTRTERYYQQLQVEVEIYEDAGEGSEVVQLVAADQDREGELTCTAHTCSTTSSSRSRWRSTRTPARAPRWCIWWPPTRTERVEVEVYEDAGEGSEVVQLVAADQDREGELTCTAHTSSTTSSSRSRWRSTRTAARAPRWCSWWPPTRTERHYQQLQVEVEVFEDAGEGSEVVQLVAADQDREGELTCTHYQQLQVEVEVYEDAGEGSEVVQLVAADQDREAIYHTVRYQINYVIDPDLRRFFAVEQDTGRVYVDFTTDAVLDRDGDEPTHRIFLNLIDNLFSEGEGSRNTVAIEVLVILLDVNDNAPELPSPDETSWTISEGLTQGVRLSPDIHAHDRDQPFTNNSRVAYEVAGLRAVDRDLDVPDLLTIVTVPDEELWEFHGELETAMDLRGYWGTYEIRIRAYDHGDPMLDSYEWYQISIAPYNFHAPEFVFPLTGTTVRLSKERSANGPLVTVADTFLESLHATDEDGLHAGEVDFSVVANADAVQYFEIDNLGDNRGDLRLARTFDEDVREFQVTIRATDRGTDPGPQSTDTILNVVFVPSLADPTFATDTATVAFMEQVVNVETQQLPLAEDLKNYRCEDDCYPIYYRIVEGNSEGHFELDASTNVLSVVRALDREVAPSHQLVVAASNSPTATPTQGSLITVTVNVREANPRPIFVRRLYTAGISTLDTIGRELLTLQASHSENAPLTYEIDSASMQVDGSLETVRELAFQLNQQTGVLTLQIQPTANMHGMFEFDVVATDPAGETDRAEVKVYLISSRNRVSFIFVNTVEEIEANRDFIAETFSTAFDMTCNIDQVTPNTDDSGVALADQTDVRAHLIRDDIPVPAEEIEYIRADTQLLFTIQMALRTQELQLLDFVTDLSPEESSDASLITIYVLAALSAVLAFLCLLLLLTFIVRTRTLNRRLEALSMTKYGSVDSGLNRAGLAAPGTNKYATEGANPIWNETFKAPDFDAISDASGDSDLIGIEEMPQFRSDYFPPGDTSSEQGFGEPVGVHRELPTHSNNFGFHASPFSTDFTDRQFRRN